MLFLITLRGQPGDEARYHVSNGLYLKPVIDAIEMPYTAVERFEDLQVVGRAYRHASVIGRPCVVGLGRELQKGAA